MSVNRWLIFGESVPYFWIDRPTLDNNEIIGADSSKTRKHVMPENVLSENYVPISRVKLVLYCLRPAQSMNGRSVLDFRPTL